MSKSDGKTEKATPQRRKKAREEGQVSRSQEVGVAASLLVAAFFVQVFGPSAAETMLDETRLLLSSATGDHIPTSLLWASFGRVLMATVVPILVIATAAALVSGFGQVGFKPSWKAAKPKLKKLNPKQGAQKLKPGKASWELVRAVTKIGLLVLLITGPMLAWRDDMGSGQSLDQGVADVLAQAWTLLLRGVMLAVVVAAADYAWQRWQNEKKMKMSKYEVKKEHKDTEGDPMLRQARKRRAQELSRNRMLSDVAAADVVVTNPTHLAVALRYGDEDLAPRVVAKGADALAAKIRQIAHRHGVTVTEDKALARSLYRRCRLDDHVPAALYEAVAVVLALAYRRRRRAPTSAGTR